MPTERAGFTVPNWFMAVIKWTAPALGVGVWMYIQLALMQKDIDSINTRLASLQATIDARSDGQSTLSQKVGNIEVKQASDGKSIADSLLRIEGNIKDIQADIKDINRRIPEKR